MWTLENNKKTRKRLVLYFCRPKRVQTTQTALNLGQASFALGTSSSVWSPALGIRAKASDEESTSCTFADSTLFPFVYISLEDPVGRNDWVGLGRIRVVLDILVKCHLNHSFKNSPSSVHMAFPLLSVSIYSPTGPPLAYLWYLSEIQLSSFTACREKPSSILRMQDMSPSSSMRSLHIPALVDLETCRICSNLLAIPLQS